MAGDQEPPPKLPPDTRQDVRRRVQRAMLLGPPLLMVFMIGSTGTALIGAHLTSNLIPLFAGLIGTTLLSGLLYLIVTERQGRWRSLLPAASFAPIFLLLVFSFRSAGWDLHGGVLPGAIAGVLAGIVAWLARRGSSEA